MNLKHRNYENLRSKWLIVNRKCSRSFSNSSWDKQPHQYMGRYLSSELWQRLTNVSSGRTAGLNSPNCLFLPPSCSFRCALEWTRATWSIWVTIQPHKNLQWQTEEGVAQGAKGTGREGCLSQHILVRLGLSSPRSWDPCSFSAQTALKLAQVSSWGFPGALHPPSLALVCEQGVGTVGHCGVGMCCTWVKHSR